MHVDVTKFRSSFDPFLMKFVSTFIYIHTDVWVFVPYRLAVKQASGGSAGGRRWDQRD